MQEIDQVMHAATTWRQRCVVATVVRTAGSSYRKPGAVMLVGEDGTTIGAVSGGCIEKEIVRRSQQVFSSNKPELIEYDGRYTLGCNGTLYILIEPFLPAKAKQLFQRYRQAFDQRESWTWVSQYDENYSGSIIVFNNDEIFALRDEDKNQPSEIPIIPEASIKFDQHPISETRLVHRVQPSVRLCVIGSEIDAVKLATIASEVGYIVTLILHPLNNEVEISAPGVSVMTAAPEQLSEVINADPHTALVLTTHSYSRDLGYLRSVCQLETLRYLGIVGPKERADELLSELLEQGLELPDWFDQVFRAPVGLDLGGQFPAEIAISILGELQLVLSGHAGGILSEKKAGIHSRLTVS